MSHDVRLLILALFMVSSNHVAEISAKSSHYEHPRRSLHHMPRNSSSDAFKLTTASSQGENQITHYCTYYSGEAAYFGTIATIDVYDFGYLNKRVSTAAQIVLGNRNTSNQVLAGWEVNPELYGDSKPHFFVYWTNDGKDGCSNLDCVGFVPINVATIKPGDTLEPSNGQKRIALKVFKSEYDGDWWLHFGHDVNNLSPVGYWPKDLIIAMKDHADVIEWGGITLSYSGEISPPMGNGQWPRSNTAASFRNVQYVDKYGKRYDPPMGGLHAVETHRNCYQTGVFRLQVQGNMFYYGGPGGCTS
uniref:Neprosin PEP catalytic domain-containing protein n=1 Tax=Hordeum vulgare subsp. vulgare TaxID=112509 RepID=A0A8I6Y3H0_HORVV